MRRHIRTASTLCLLLSAAWLAGPAIPVAQAQTCSSGATTTLMPGVSGRPQNVNVQVYIDPAFQGEARTAVMDAFNSWEAASGPDGNNSGVTFTFVDTEPLPGVDSHKVWREAPRDPVRGSTLTYPSTGFISGATTQLNPAVTSYAAIREVMAHEIGHGMGLDDCATCSTSDSVMSAGPPAGADPNTVVGRPTSPTACDNAAISAGISTEPDGGGSGDLGGGDGWNELPEGGLTCTHYYRYGVISYDGGRTWYLEYARYEGCW